MGILQPRHRSSCGVTRLYEVYIPPLDAARGEVGAVNALPAMPYPFPVWRGASSGYFTTSINPYSAASSGLIQ